MNKCSICGKDAGKFFSVCADCSGKNTVYKSPYGAARSVAGLLSIVGWFVVVVGGLYTVLMVGRDAGFLLSFVIGGAISLSGLVSVAAAQIMLATVDNADNTRAILEAIVRRTEQGDSKLEAI